MKQVEKWRIFEQSFKVSDVKDPFKSVEIKAVFTSNQQSIETYGFYDGDNTFVIRCMPWTDGIYKYVVSSNHPELDGKSGEFECIAPAKNNHGMVKVKKDVSVGGFSKDPEDAFHFSYIDGTPYHPFGTTVYAFVYQSDELQEETLATLKETAFNKIRICVCPKHYRYNEKEPTQYPYIKVEDHFDYETFDPKFFRYLEKRILQLDELGIECDLILFHAYDRWGFSKMTADQDDHYLKYVISRLCSFKNIWWSLANEYDLLTEKSNQDWERFARVIMATDPYDHLRSIHNCMDFYDHSRPWITHCSIQRVDVYKTSEAVEQWRNTYHKPIVVDECAYEGNIDYGWGNISGEEMTRRFYEGVIRGGYLTHGETYTHPQDILWWSHGGKLHGTSPKRIAFLRQIVEEAKGDIACHVRTPENHLYHWDVTCGQVKDQQYFYYFGFMRPSFRNFKMPDGIQYHIDIIDTWEMTITSLEGTYEGEFSIDMPGKPYILVRLTAVE